MEWNEEIHQMFWHRIGQYHPNQLIFIDESTFDRRVTYRQMAWAIQGERVHHKEFFVHGKW